MGLFTQFKQLVKDGMDKERGSGRQEETGRVVWQETWQDEATLDQNWIRVDCGGGFGNQELQTYKPANCRVEAGALVIRAVADAHAADLPYTSAKLFCRRPFSCKKGKITIELLDVPTGVPGIWPAIWAMPNRGTPDIADGKTWPTCGEIDMFETGIGQIDHATFAYHWGSYTAEDAWKHATNAIPCNGRGPHTIALEWDDRGLTFWFDHKIAMGPMTMPVEDGRSAQVEDFSLILNVAMGGNATGNVTPAQGVYEMRVGKIEMYEYE